jgi:IclR family acetate operon transcriptional repressor
MKRFRISESMSMRPVRISLQILEEVASLQPVGTSELARRLSLSKTTVHRALISLAESGWIELAGEGRKAWQLSMHALVVAGRAMECRSGLRSVAIPVMEGLRRSTEETVHLVVPYRGSVALLERLDGIKPVRVFHPFGGRAPLHLTSSGKAILAHLPQAELEAYLVEKLSRETAGKAKTQSLLKELRWVRKRGFAVNLGQNVPDANAAGAAILGENDRPIAAITISAPSERMPEKLCLIYGELVNDAARRISLGLRIPRQG